MTVTTERRRSEWSALTERLSADHAGHDITIEVLDPEGGDSSLVERLPFSSITYDHKDDVLVVSVGGRPPPTRWCCAIWSTTRRRSCST